MAWELCIDPKWLQEIMKDLLEWWQQAKAPVKDIVSLHSQLSFIAHVVKPGRIFLQRIVEKMQQGLTMESQIQLSEEFFQSWTGGFSLLPKWNRNSIIPDFQWVSNAAFDLFTDASSTGFGACWQGAWLTGEFTDWYAMRAWPSKNSSPSQ